MAQPETTQPHPAIGPQHILSQGLLGSAPHSCFPSYVLYRFSVGRLKIKQARDVLTKLDRKVKLSLSIAKDTFTGGQMSFPSPLGKMMQFHLFPLPILPPFFF